MRNIMASFIFEKIYGSMIPSALRVHQRTHSSKSKLEIEIGAHLVLGPFTERATRFMVFRLQFLHELNFVSPWTKILPQIFQKVNGHSSNCCARWRMHSFGSFFILCSTAAIATSVRSVRHRWGCALSTRVNVVRSSIYQLCWTVISIEYW